MTPKQPGLFETPTDPDDEHGLKALGDALADAGNPSAWDWRADADEPEEVAAGLGLVVPFTSPGDVVKRELEAAESKRRGPQPFALDGSEEYPDSSAD